MKVFPDGFLLGDEDLAPPRATWAGASRRDRVAYYREAARFVELQKKRDVLAGRGASGHYFRARVGQGGGRGKGGFRRGRVVGGGPPLAPHGFGSRTAGLLRTRATWEGVFVRWLKGRRPKGFPPWWEILGYHRAGIPRGKGVVKRDSFGLSGRGRRAVVKTMAKWWTRHAQRVS